MNERKREAVRERENKREEEEPLASQQIKPSAHLSAVTVTAHQCHWQLAKLMGKCHASSLLLFAPTKWPQLTRAAKLQYATLPISCCPNLFRFEEETYFMSAPTPPPSLSLAHSYPCPFPLSYFCCYYYYYIIFESVHRSHLCNICVEAMIYGLPKHYDKC